MAAPTCSFAIPARDSRTAMAAAPMSSWAHPNTTSARATLKCLVHALFDATYDSRTAECVGRVPDRELLAPARFLVRKHAAIIVRRLSAPTHHRVLGAFGRAS